jgi:hypothetical protein
MRLVWASRFLEALLMQNCVESGSDAISVARMLYQLLYHNQEPGQTSSV